jgi:hypothetical protein
MRTYKKRGQISPANEENTARCFLRRYKSGSMNSEGLLVGARGFEPPTSRSRTVRATKLRYAPYRN